MRNYICMVQIKSLNAEISAESDGANSEPPQNKCIFM